MDVVHLCGAKMFVMENVTELLRSDEFGDIAKRAEDMGFDLISDVFNAADFGTPQTRKRAIIIGWKKRFRCRASFPRPNTYKRANARVTAMADSS